MTKKNVRPVQSKNNWGLVRMDGTAKLVRMMRKTKRLSTDSDFSTMYAAKYSLPN